MKIYGWNLIEEEQLNPLLRRQVIHGEKLSVARLQLQRFAVVPMHSHANEQITMLQQGSLRFIVNGEQRVLRAGEILIIPPDSPHMVEALEDSIALDLFAPTREDWIRGDDSYLRK